MSDFDKALAFVLRAEGGYVNDPNDPGGATNQGITQRTYDTYNDSKGLPHGDVKIITPVEVQNIYGENYWRAAGCDMLPWPLNLAIFDCAVNQGLGMAKQVLRSVDGLSTTATIAVRRYVYRRLADSNPNLSKFLPGWLNRLNNLLKELE